MLTSVDRLAGQEVLPLPCPASEFDPPLAHGTLAVRTQAAAMVRIGRTPRSEFTRSPHVENLS